MAAPADTPPVLGFIGFGEAAEAFATGFEFAVCKPSYPERLLFKPPPRFLNELRQE